MIEKKELYRLYIEEKKSIPEISKILEKSKSTVRSWLLDNNIPLRSRLEALKMARHKMGKHRKGGKYPHKKSTIEKLRKKAIERGELNSKGVSLKPSGYLEITRGEHKFKNLHRQIMEKHIGRKLGTKEHVHHIDGNKLNNEISNLEILSLSEHMRKHRKEDGPIPRNKLGQFIKGEKK